MKRFVYSLFVILFFLGCGNTTQPNTDDKNENITPAKVADLTFYAVMTDHPSSSLSSSSNKVKLLKVVRKDGKVSSELIKEFGSFTSVPDLYTVTYGSSSDADAPKAGYDINEFYKGTIYEGFSERFGYASETLEEMLSKIQTDITNKTSLKYPANFRGSLNNSGNFWTNIFPKQGLYDSIDAI